MDFITAFLFGISIFLFISFLKKYFDGITKHLRIIRLQLEIQNPMFVSEELLELDKNINYWHEKMFKYKDDISEKNKEISQLTFDLFWLYVEKQNRLRIMIAEVKKIGNPTKIHEKYEKWLNKNEENIKKMEKRVKEIDRKISEDLEKRDLDIEFLGKWDKDES